MCHRHALFCIIPPYIIERLAHSTNPRVRACAIANLQAGSYLRAQRSSAQATPGLMANRSPTGEKNRLVYDARQTSDLPGVLVRREGEAAGGDEAVNEAYDGAGVTYDFYEQMFGRNSLDDQGMSLISSVHVAEPSYDNDPPPPMNNAFWNGQQMAYGDGDGEIFGRFTQALEVIAHELTHGVQSFTSNLAYHGQSGALNEHFADVFGVLVRQWNLGQTVDSANWLIGDEVLITSPTRRGIRDMENPGTAYVDDPDLGSDPQPAHMKDIYTGTADSGGVHINSGIPNRAFVLVAKALGGQAWEVAGRIWYATMLQLSANSDFQACASVSAQVAQARFGAPEKRAVVAAWKKVGITL
jgi:Zn-dependent metalloprotease